MTPTKPSYMTRLRLWWEGADAILAKHAQPPLTYEEARMLFDSELSLEDVAEVLEAELEKAGA
jgi:hypothetical protein